MRKSLTWLDPYQQSFLFFKWNFLNILVCGIAVLWLANRMESSFGVTYYGQDGHWLMSNPFTYLPNYLIHEMLGHNFVGNIGWQLCYRTCRSFGMWWAAAMGNGMETLVPLGLYLGALRLRGGRYFLPLLLYWVGNTLYEAAIYAADARAMKLALTSSDMMTNHSAGEVLGDWHYILQPLGLLPYDVLIGHILMYVACFCVVMAFYSAWYYWRHMEEYSLGRMEY